MANLKVAFFIKVISSLIKNISPDVKEFILDNINKLDEKAQTTKNPFDDLLVDFLKAIFS